jgi:hypothetical protein
MFSTWCPHLSLNFDAQILYGYIARERLSAEAGSLKVVGNEKLGGSRLWLLFEDGFGPW